MAGACLDMRQPVVMYMFIVVLILLGANKPTGAADTSGESGIDVASVLAAHPEEAEPDQPFTPGSRLDPDIAAILAKHGADPDESGDVPTKPDEAVSETGPVTTGLLSVTIADDSGPCAARITLSDPDGTPVANLPGLGWRWGGSGTNLRLPVGAYNINIERGVRQVPKYGVVRITDGETTQYSATLMPFAPVTHTGWRQFDPFFDARGRIYASLEDAGVAARGEGLSVAGLLGTAEMPGPFGLPYRSMKDGAERLAEAFDLAARQEYRSVSVRTGTLPGGAAYYVLERSPSVSNEGSEATARQGELYFETLARFRERGAAIVLSHPVGLLTDIKTGEAEHVAGELIFDIVAARQFDALDLGRGGENLDLWQALLNEGHYLTALSGKPSIGSARSPDVPAIGAYLYLPEKRFTAPDVVDAVKTGEAVVSTGPFLQLLIEGRRPGGVLHPSRKPRTVFLEALSGADRLDAIDRIELVYNGRVIESYKGEKLQKSVRASFHHEFPDVGWVLARYRSSDTGHWAVTNPVKIIAGTFGSRAPATASVTLTVTDSHGNPVQRGIAEVWNLGSRLQVLTIPDGPIKLELPATARIRLSAENCAPRELVLYRDGGPEAYIRTLRTAGRLRSALQNPDTYREMESILKNMKLTVRMSPSDTGNRQ